MDLPIRRPQGWQQRYAQADHRIKLFRRSENGGIAAASNSGLQLATGEFVGFVDHDDLLSPHALYMVAEAAYRHPTAEIFYTDEDKMRLRRVAAMIHTSSRIGIQSCC